jgi:hypothetical protein|tara:strand:- start:220 stop:471 length:252 start_codon:yes stop_codon:yes gene_type:complete
MDLGEIVTSERAETAIKALEIAEAENKRLIARVKELQFDCAERAKTNSELVERVKRLAMRTPSWPKGFRPQGRRSDNRRDDRR